MDKELQRAITLTELAPSPYFSIINVYLVDINVFEKFNEIPSLPFQETEKPKCHERTDRQCENRGGGGGAAGAELNFKM